MLSIVFFYFLFGFVAEVSSDNVSHERHVKSNDCDNS